MLGVVVVAVIGAAAGIFVVEREAPGMWRSLVAIDAGLIVALAVAVHVLMGPTMGKLDELIEALRALSRGDRQTRLPADDFGGLAGVARAINDVGASLCENDDPNLGPIKKVARATPVRRPISDNPRPSSGNSGSVRKATLEEVANAPGVGEVRPSKKPAVLPTITPPSSSSTANVATSNAAPGAPATPTPKAVAHPSAAANLPRAAEPRLEVSAPHARISPFEPAEPSEPSEPSDANDSILPRSVGADGVSEPRPTRKSAKKAKKAAAAAARDSVLPGPALSLPEPETIAPAAVDASVDGVVDATLEPVAVVEVAAPGDHTVVAVIDSDASSSSSSSSDTVIEPALELPTRAELQHLFDEFLREKKAARQLDGLDVDFDAFVETIRSESERLVVEHQCRGVRFEIAVAEGEVSLRPRLIR